MTVQKQLLTAEDFERFTGQPAQIVTVMLGGGVVLPGCKLALKTVFSEPQG